MSFATALTVNDGVGDHVFDTVDVGNYKTTRRDASASLDQPSLFEIAHQFKGDVSQTKVHFHRIVENAQEEQGKVEAYTVIKIPQKVATSTDVKKAIDSLRAFLNTAGNVDKLLNYES